jgi:hypothetical protein
VAEPDHAVIDLPRGKDKWFSARTKLALGYVFAGACLVWVFHDFHPGRFLADFKSIDPRWVALAVVFDVASYVVQGLRSQLGPFMSASSRMRFCRFASANSCAATWLRAGFLRNSFR